MDMEEHEIERYTKDLGALVNNLHVLEYFLRAYLYEHEGDSFDALPAGLDWYNVQPGDELPLNALTSYETLGQLIDRYNSIVNGRAPAHMVDRSIVDVRDSIAHGRVSGPLHSPHMVLLKFDRPQGKVSRVAVAQRLTPEWLEDQRVRVLREAEKVFERRHLDSSRDV